MAARWAQVAFIWGISGKEGESSTFLGVQKVPKRRSRRVRGGREEGEERVRRG